MPCCISGRGMSGSRMRHAVLAELPGGERGPLVARAGSRRPRHGPRCRRSCATVRSARRSGAEIDGGEPAGMQWSAPRLVRLASFFARCRGNQLGAIDGPDSLVDGDASSQISAHGDRRRQRASVRGRCAPPPSSGSSAHWNYRGRAGRQEVA